MLNLAIFYGLLFIFVNIGQLSEYYSEFSTQHMLRSRIGKLVTRSLLALDPTLHHKRKAPVELYWHRGLLKLALEESTTPQSAQGRADSEMWAINSRRGKFGVENETASLSPSQQALSQKVLLKAQTEIKLIFRDTNDQNAFVKLQTWSTSSMLHAEFLLGVVYFLSHHKETANPAAPNPVQPNAAPVAQNAAAANNQLAKPIAEAPSEKLCEFCSTPCKNLKLKCGHYFHWDCLQSMVLQGKLNCNGQRHQTIEASFMRQFLRHN